MQQFRKAGRSQRSATVYLAEGVLIALACAMEGDDIGGGAPQVEAPHAARKAVLRLEVHMLPQCGAAEREQHRVSARDDSTALRWTRACCRGCTSRMAADLTAGCVPVAQHVGDDEAV